MREKLQLLFTGFLQVFFVSINTYFIANLYYIGIAFVAFAISFIWSFNIKKVAFGTMADRVMYSIGAMLGSLFGTFISSLVLVV